ncbi:glycosyltransferase family 2 protein [Altericista sp. CCNU0014]|uniref:glycosyltransferase family 2 protein n=1 Tax=Altericista sp. CCNU0014 TaxID=3082949 RepID=UPI00384AAAC8
MKLGIVTISYNQAKYLQQAIESVRLQNTDRLRYVIVDAGSQDNSREIILKNKERFSEILLEPDRGPADGLNKGFSKLEDAEILGYLNSDDVFAPGALDFVMNFFAENPKVDVLNGAIRIIDDRNRISWRGRTSDAFNLIQYSMGICTICQQATFFRRQAFQKAGGFNLENRTCWDGELMVDMALAKCKFATTQKVLGYFRIYPDSITGSNRFKVQYDLDRNRIDQKIFATSSNLHPRSFEKIYRLFYKMNLWRHLQYLIVR